jgi:pyrimidine operon attenuation protein/uracil phosphoribosyltransferase
MNKENPADGAVLLEPKVSDLHKKTVIICDDVLYSGRTIAYASIPFLEASVKKLECLVLISRNHLKYPVHPAYVGLSLATTLQEHVRVHLEASSKVVLE